MTFYFESDLVSPICAGPIIIQLKDIINTPIPMQLPSIHRTKSSLFLFQTYLSYLQEGLAEGAPHQGAAGTDGVLLGLVAVGELGVHLDQVDSHEVAGLVHSLADVVTLTEGEAASDRSASARSPHGVEGVDIEGQVDGGVAADVGEGHLDDAANTVAMVAG